jgi:uncharacterized protein (TIGR02246 family)
MRHAIFILILALALLGCQTLSTISPDPKADVASATKAWRTAVNNCDPSVIASLYADGAVLWGTTSTSLITTTKGVHEYFAANCKALKDVNVQFGDQAIRVYGDAAVNSGTYTWNFTRDGVPRSLLARYSFTYVRQAGGWLIVDHHSSVLPARPTQPAAPSKQ